MQKSMPTRAIEKAHERILKAYARGEKRMADIPLMQGKVDPRTAKRHQLSSTEDLLLHRLHLDSRTKGLNTPEVSAISPTSTEDVGGGTLGGDA